MSNIISIQFFKKICHSQYYIMLILDSKDIFHPIINRSVARETLTSPTTLTAIKEHSA